MSKTATILFALCTLFCSACSWVDDDQSDCPTGCWLKLSYTYNMLNVDAVTTQVKDVTLFILDQEGNYIVREEVDSLTFHQNECTIQVPSLPQGDYTFLVWAGLADSLYRHTPTSLTLLRNEAGEQSEKLSSLFHGRLDNVHISGEYQVLALSLTKNTNILSCILQSQSAAPLAWAGLADSLYRHTPTSLTLLRNEAGEQSEKLSSLFHGRLDNVHISGEYQVLALSLTKNTNILSCILQSQSAAPLDTDDFRLELTARNGCMDHRNTPTDSVFTCYLPFMQESANLEDIQVVHAGMNTLRLMENDDTRLRLIYQPSGKEIFDIPLTPYLLLSRNVETTYMPPQEYLDRQDRYNLIFFLSPTEDPQKPYICLQMQVNGWIIRINDAELDK